MILELAVGDALGAGFEFVKTPPPNDLKGYVKHPTHRLITGGVGRYTDDTQMSIGCAEAILEPRLHRETFIEKWVECFKRDVREGYTPSFYNFLCEIADAEEFAKRIRPDSDKSGACMRVLPLCYLPTLNEATRWATAQAMITHNTRDGIDAACAVVAMGYYLRNGLGRKVDLGEWLADEVDGRWQTTWAKNKVGVKALDCAHAAIYVVRTSHSQSEILKRSIDLTGDVDTVAAIACGAAALCDEIEQDIPTHLIDQLENGTYGRDYLIELDRRLEERYPLPGE